MMPVGAQAEATVYGRINNAVVFEDNGGDADSTTDLRTVGSRFGLKGSSDLGNGLTAHGHYEFATTTDREEDAVVDIRIATAGISGGFGRVDVGNQWSAFYNQVGIEIDPTYTIGPVGNTPYRSSNTIKYSNSIGPLSLEADLRLNDGKDKAAQAEGLRGNGAGVGLRVAATENITVALAFDADDQTDEVTAGMPKRPGLNKDMDKVVVLDATDPARGNEHSRIGFSTKVAFGNFWGSLAIQNHEAEDRTGKAVADKELIALYAGASFTDSLSGWVGFSQESDGMKKDGPEPSKVTLGLYQNMGGGLRLWYEGGFTDQDEAGKDDQAKHYFGIRYDF